MEMVIKNLYTLCTCNIRENVAEKKTAKEIAIKDMSVREKVFAK